eukprot:2091309-Pleurochrysis_carterae.AAC.1
MARAPCQQFWWICNWAIRRRYARDSNPQGRRWRCRDLLPQIFAGPGYKVFKGEPDEHPPFAAFKPGQSWERHIVVATVRKWIPHFTLPTEEDLEKAKGEWNERLWRMPCNLKVDNLPKLKKLVWPALPVGSMACANTTTARAGANVSERLENPSVNPITGGGQTAAMVRALVRAHQQQVRADAINNPNALSPIFHGDYLLVQLPTESSPSLTLHR